MTPKKAVEKSEKKRQKSARPVIEGVPRSIDSTEAIKVPKKQQNAKQAARPQEREAVCQAPLNRAGKDGKSTDIYLFSGLFFDRQSHFKRLACVEESASLSAIGH